jgi:hypothetical protein
MANKRFMKEQNIEKSSTQYDIKWQNNFLQWNEIMNSRVHNPTFEERFFVIKRNNQFRLLHFPKITYRQLARLKYNPDIVHFSPTQHHTTI